MVDANWVKCTHNPNKLGTHTGSIPVSITAVA